MYARWECLTCDSKKTRRIGTLTYSMMVLCDPKCHINMLTKSIYTKVWSRNQLGPYQFIQREMTIYFMWLDNMVTDGFGKLENNWCMFKQLIIPITHIPYGPSIIPFQFWVPKCWIQPTPSQCWDPNIEWTDFCPFLQQARIRGTRFVTARGHIQELMR